MVAFGLSWLLAFPLWLGDGLVDPLFGVIALAMMFTPAIAAIVVVFVVERPQHKARMLGLWPLKPAGRFIGHLALGLIVPVTLILVALPVGALLGVWVGLQLINVFVGAFINLIPALGEELGWRGWLLPKLMPLGTVPALVLSGVIWELWHSPLILLGYNYPAAQTWLGLTMMIGMCIIVGAVFGWLRLHSESVWPAALAHGAFNAAAGFSLIFAAAGESIDTTQATILGWSG